jgi:cell division protein FtsB
MAAARIAAARFRWDRLGRIALLCVLGLVLYLYIGPTRSWISTWQEAKHRRAEVAELQARNRALRARRDELRRPSALEREARKLGMVKAGERAYVVTGLPKP